MTPNRNSAGRKLDLWNRVEPVKASAAQAQRLKLMTEKQQFFHAVLCVTSARRLVLPTQCDKTRRDKTNPRTGQNPGGDLGLTPSKIDQQQERTPISKAVEVREANVAGEQRCRPSSPGPQQPRAPAPPQGLAEFGIFTEKPHFGDVQTGLLTCPSVGEPQVRG